MRGRKLSRISIYFARDQLERFRQFSEESGAPVAELVRRALDAYLASRSVDPGRESRPWVSAPVQPEGFGVSDTRIERHAGAGDLAGSVVAHGAGTA
jgi:hypothetical protein